MITDWLWVYLEYKNFEKELNAGRFEQIEVNKTDGEIEKSEKNNKKYIFNF